MTSKQFHIPLNPEVKDRKARFVELNEFVRSMNGWLRSVPGDVEITIDCLPSSPLPEKLRKMGYTVTETGQAQRILSHAVVDRYVIGAGGELELATAGSTRPISSTVSHAGIVTVTIYDVLPLQGEL
jgi:hypothetical protein